MLLSCKSQILNIVTIEILYLTKFLKKNFLDFKSLKKIKSYAQKIKITLFATRSDFQSLDIIKKLNFPAIKISSGLLTNEALICEIAKLKKPLILSTGMAYLNEIKKAILILKKNKFKSYALLKCTSLYPCKPNLVNLKSIKNLKQIFQKTPIGYSDHTLGIDTCVAAVALGAKIIEKHITLDKNLKVQIKKSHAIQKNLKKWSKKLDILKKLLVRNMYFLQEKKLKKITLSSIYNRCKKNFKRTKF